jgi:hypothetical protein
MTVARRVILASFKIEENGDKNFWKLNEELVLLCAEVEDGRRRSNSPDKDARGFIISRRFAGDGGSVYSPLWKQLDRIILLICFRMEMFVRCCGAVRKRSVDGPPG